MDCSAAVRGLSQSVPACPRLDKTATMSNVPAATATASMHLAGNLTSFLCSTRIDKYVSVPVLSPVNKSRHFIRYFSSKLLVSVCFIIEKFLENFSYLLYERDLWYWNTFNNLRHFIFMITLSQLNISYNNDTHVILSILCIYNLNICNYDVILSLLSVQSLLLKN